MMGEEQLGRKHYDSAYFSISHYGHVKVHNISMHDEYMIITRLRITLS